MSKKLVNENGYTDDPEVLYKEENVYIRERRVKNNVCELIEEDGCRYLKNKEGKKSCGLSEEDDCKKLWGVCFSGGGIRSATFCLGLMQGLIKADIFRLFDYLSTVSGGGYIGSCLTSLLSKEPEPKDPFYEQNVSESAETGTSPREPSFVAHKAFDCEKTGVTPEESPFVSLNEYDDSKKRVTYETAKDTILGARHQMHHLRTHSEYLVSNRKIRSKEMLRAVGSVFSGLIHHMFMFALLLLGLTTLLHSALFLITGNLQEYPTSKNYDDVQLLKELNYSKENYYRISDEVLLDLGKENIDDAKILALGQLKDMEFFKGEEDFISKLNELTTGDGDKLNEKDKKLIVKYATARDISRLDYLINNSKIWLYSRIGAPLFEMFIGGIKTHWRIHAGLLLIGVLISILTFNLGDYCSINKIEENMYHRKNEVKEKESDKEEKEDVIEKVKSGATIEDHYEEKFIKCVSAISFIILIFPIFIVGGLNAFDAKPCERLYVLFLPLGLSMGMAYGALAIRNLRRNRLTSLDYARRTMYNSLVGASFYCIVLSIIIPVGIVFLFSLSFFKLDFWWALISLVLSHAIFKGSGDGGKIKKLIFRYKKILFLILILLFISLFFNFISHLLIKYFYPYISGILTPIIFIQSCLIPFIISLLSLGLMCIAGIIIDSNRVSPHYFYRDRLTEAYLKTDARIKRSDSAKKQQGMPLINIRNHEGLRLAKLGEDNGKGPYHILVGAINLQGSEELNRKQMLSEHFIFSKYYVGSKITGYVKTPVYRGGETKLARAMTISAAAASSAMGQYSSGAGSFAATLFNVRLGYWMANPWYYNKENIDYENIEPTWPFWPRWLFKEMMGKVTARNRLVNLSDGGHTGDNLGIMPLLERRCKVIVVCDAEADYGYDFGSFNNAVRMIYIENKIKIDIDLSPIIPKKKKDGTYELSTKSVVIGDIHYPPETEPDDKNNEKNGTTGKLVYIKASMSQPVDEKTIPVHVKNYNVENKTFPHQTTADQFFDNAQFEAYRALGEYIAEQSIVEMADKKEFKNELPGKVQKLFSYAKSKILSA